MNEFTAEAKTRLIDYLNTHHIPSGLGTKEEACSIAAINLAIDGRLTDSIPDCMSEVIGRWIIRIQDRMPDEIRNSPEWKGLLPLAAGTGRKLEEQRRALVMNWMWNTLASIQNIADKRGFGEAWAEMIKKRDAKSARKARADAYVYAAAYAYAADYAAAAAAGAAYAYAYDYAAAAARKKFWQDSNPVEMLRQLIEVQA